MGTFAQNLFPERFYQATEHPRKTIRDAIHSRFITKLGQVDTQTYPSGYNSNLTEGDEGYIAPILVDKYWTPAGPNVFQRKEVEIDFGDMPLILLRYEGERVLGRAKTGWEGYTERQIDLSIEPYVLVTPGESAEQQLDEMAFYIEACMNGFDLNAYNCEPLLASTEYETEFDNSQPVAVGRLLFEIKYLCPHLGIDFGLWDRDDACISNTGPTPPVQTVVVRNNFGTETYDYPDDFPNHYHD
jgi:hypothetical protein|tara:strand:+ start:2038 stop:2766 length:729 start_codon:yes stop_codon:yes gene_type:complete